jgi:hypothetical protein
MYTETTYRCEICHTGYRKAAQALACEDKGLP